MLEKCRMSGFADEIDRNLDVQIELLKELGQGYLELRAADGVGVADMSAEQAKGFAARLADAGIRVSALGSPIGKIGIGDDFEPHFEKFRHVAELAEIFQTRYIRMFSFYIPEGEKPEDFRGQVTERMERMVKYAAGKGIVLLHENEKGIYGDMAPRCLELAERFYGENFKCIFDFANFVQCGQDTLEAYRLLKPYIHYIHVKDAVWDSGEVVAAGEGDGHLAEILSDLDRAGFDGFLSLEPHLFHFAGLEKLERAPQKRREGSGAAAYRYAFESFRRLLVEGK